MKYSLLTFAIALSLTFCNTKKSNTDSSHSSTPSYLESNSSSSEHNNQDDGESWKDGDYCATVTYHNSNTGTTSTYQLTVEVEDGELTVIHWPNGGWLDASHFTPEEVDEDGAVSFTSDRGYDYEVQLQDEGPCNFVSGDIDDEEGEDDNEDEDEEEAEEDDSDENE